MFVALTAGNLYRLHVQKISCAHKEGDKPSDHQDRKQPKNTQDCTSPLLSIKYQPNTEYYCVFDVIITQTSSAADISPLHVFWTHHHLFISPQMRPDMVRMPL